MVYPSTLPGNVPFALERQVRGPLCLGPGRRGPPDSPQRFPVPPGGQPVRGGNARQPHELLRRTHLTGNCRAAASEVEIEHARLDFVNAFGTEHLFNFRIGKLAPNAWDGFQEMWIMTDNGIDTFFGYNPIGFNGGNGTLRKRLLRRESAGQHARHRDVRHRGASLAVRHRRRQPDRAGRHSRLFREHDPEGRLRPRRLQVRRPGARRDLRRRTLPPENWARDLVPARLLRLRGKRRAESTTRSPNRGRRDPSTSRTPPSSASACTARSTSGPERLRRLPPGQGQACSSSTPGPTRSSRHEESHLQGRGSCRPTTSSFPPSRRPCDTSS